LNPFLDGNQFLRLGGRLRNADMMFDQQYPLILPKGHNVTTLIIEDIHKKNLHVSGRLLLFLTRQKFWIIDTRNVLRKVTQNFLTCFRLKPATSTKLMGQYLKCESSLPNNLPTQA
jgi:hypothetical protein